MILTPFEEMLGQDESTEIALSQIDAFPGHPFQVRLDEDMEKLIESIGQSGVIVPVILRKKQDGRYETIAGHRRCVACRQMGIEHVPAVIREMSEEDAVLCMVDSNIQRTCILPSEKAKAYRMKMEALSRQGKRTDLMENDSPRQCVGKWKRETAERIGNDAGDSGRKVQRYLRLNYLTPELLKKVDEKKMPFLSGVELSYLPKKQQEEVLRYLTEYPCSIAVAQAKRLRELGEQSQLSQNEIADALQKNAKEKEKLQDDSEKELFPEYFPKDYSRKQRQGIMEALLQKWKKGEIQL